MTNYRRIHRDANHVPIVNELRARGYSVADFAGAGNGVPDILVHKRNTVFIELKMPNGFFRLNQLLFLAQWKGLAGFAETVEQCIALEGDPWLCLKDSDKARILQIVERRKVTSKAKDPQITVKSFEKEFRNNA